MDLNEVEYRIEKPAHARQQGARPARRRPSWSCLTATRARLRELEKRIADDFRILQAWVPVSGQTYSPQDRPRRHRNARRYRRIRFQVRNRPASAAAPEGSRGAVREEPDRLVRYAYKRNPMRSERICALALCHLRQPWRSPRLPVVRAHA